MSDDELRRLARADRQRTTRAINAVDDLEIVRRRIAVGENMHDDEAGDESGRGQRSPWLLVAAAAAVFAMVAAGVVTFVQDDAPVIRTNTPETVPSTAPTSSTPEPTVLESTVPDTVAPMTTDIDASPPSTPTQRDVQTIAVDFPTAGRWPQAMSGAPFSCERPATRSNLRSSIML